MTHSQMTRILNWAAMSIALLVCGAVLQHIYKRHFDVLENQQTYSFSDLPALDAAPVTANIEKISNKHIFGEAPLKLATALPKPDKPTPPPAPITPLNIKLTGIVLGKTPETGMAMFEVERGRTIVVAVNEDIGKTEATLNQVLAGEALIDRNGAIESVKMVRQSLNIAKLDKALIDTLPQPYIESEDESQYGRNISEPQEDPLPKSVEESDSPLNTNVRISSPLQRARK